MENEIPDFDKYLKKSSSRHHYIPQFLIKGFTNSDGLLYVYDKHKDKILKRQLPPKSIFYQPDRNTVEINSTTKSSIIEDLLYFMMDNKTSKVIQQYQTQELAEIDFKSEDTAILLFFLISLFWRIPKTDYAAEDLIVRSTIIASGIDPEILRNDPTYKKLTRAGIFSHHVDEIVKFGNRENKRFNIHQSEKPIFVIGDYPFLFKKQPTKFREFDDIDTLFAISSKRIYSSTNESLNNFSTINSFGYNAAIINQSVKYVACSDFEILEESVNYYKELKEIGIIYSNELVNEIAFKTK